MLKQIGEYLTATTLAAFVFSYVNLYTLYQLGYGIDISTYFAASEIIFSSASLLFILGSSISYTVLYMIIASIFGKSPDPKDKASVWVYASNLIVQVVFYLIVLIAFLHFSTPPYRSHFFVSIGCLTLLLLFSWIVWFNYENPKSLLVRQLIFCSTMTIFIFAFLAFNNAVISRNNVFGVKQNTTLALQISHDSTFQTSDSILFVGSNSNYFFFIKSVDHKHMETIVIPSSVVMSTKYVLIDTTLAHDPRSKKIVGPKE